MAGASVRAGEGERAAAAILFAVALPVLLMMAAFVVDLGYAYYAKQNLQDTLDLAALAAARELDGSSGEREAARRAAQAVLIDNGYAPETIDSIIFGDHSPSRPLGSRFRPETGTSGAINAVQIRGEGLSPIFFARLILDDPMDFAVVSTARTTGRFATLKIGSGLASLQDGLLNLILSNLLGANVNLTALDYNGLANANIDLLSFLDAYAVRVGLNAGDYNGLLDADVSALGVLGVVTAIAQNAASGSQAAIDLGLGLGDAFPGLSKLPLLNLQDVNVTLGELLGVGLGTVEAGLAVPVNLFDLVMASILVASTDTNGTGQHPVAVSLGSFLGASLDLSVVEMPQPPVGFRVITAEDIKNGNNILRTAQIRILLRIDWQGALAGAFSVVNGLLDVLQVLGLDVDLLPTYGPNANTNLSIGVSVAPGQAVVTALGCEATAAADRYVAMDIDAGVVSAYVGQIDRDDFLSNDAEASADPFHVLGLSYNLWGLIQPPIEILTVDLGANLPVAAPTASAEVKGSDLLDAGAFPDIHAVFDEPGHPADGEAFPSGISVGSSNLLSTLGHDLGEKLGLQLEGYLGSYVLQPLVDLLTYVVGDFLIGTLLGPLLDGIVDLLLDTLGVRAGTVEVAVVDLQCGSPRLVSP